jgi:ABC-type sugar transport system substrate-binding protein
MKKMLCVSGFCFSVFLLFAGCTASEKNSPAPGEGRSAGTDRNVTLVLKNLINPFCVTLKEGAEQAARDYKVNLTVLTPLQGDNNEELMQLTELAVATGNLDALIMFPSDSVGIIPAVKQTYDAGIPVVMLNTNIRYDEMIYETFVACENWQVGRAIGQALAEKMGYQGNVVLIEGVPGAQNSIDRIGGATEVISEYPNMKILASQPGELNRAKAMEVMQNLLQSHPEVDGVFAMNDEMALGCIEAIEAAGKSGKVIVAGCDGNNDARIAIKEGKLALTCDLVPFDQGYQAVAAAAKILNGESLETTIITKMKVIDLNNIDDRA